MKTIYSIIVILLLFGQTATAQSDTLVGVLRDTKEKVMKRHEVVLGKEKPIKVKTDKYGVFTIPNANLNDTLYIYVKKEKKEVKIPVNGYDVVNIFLGQGDYTADYRSELDSYLLDIQKRKENSLISSNYMNKEAITKTRCLDMTCLLRRMSGVQVRGSQIVIRAAASINSGTDPLLVLNGVPQEIQQIYNVRVETIEELEVLKEGTLYGVRGANGVIIIKTTKQ